MRCTSSEQGLPRTEPGDLILVKSNELIFELGRRIAGNDYDHVAVVVGDGQTLNIDKPATRFLPVGRLLRRKLHPLVLRPRFGSDDERQAFVAWMEGLANYEYDTRRTLDLVSRIIAQRFLGLRLPLSRAHPELRKWICTDAVLLGLERNCPDFSVLQDLELDWVLLGAGTTNDFLRIAALKPKLLARVA